jgi:hypothetical protein
MGAAGWSWQGLLGAEWLLGLDQLAAGLVLNTDCIALAEACGRCVGQLQWLIGDWQAGQGAGRQCTGNSLSADLSKFVRVVGVHVGNAR